MFAPSDKALTHLCNCLYALRGWFSVLEEFGLASHAEWVEMMTIGEPAYQASFDSWDSLKKRLESASGEPERLRHLCGALFRYKETYASRAGDKDKFLDALAGFEAQLVSDGYHFDGFEIVGSRFVPSVAQLADEALESALRSQQMPLGDKILESLERARAHLAEDRHNECLTHLRLALKYTLEGIAKKRAASRGEELPSEREAAVRDYLKSIGFLSEEEWRGFQGIYGLLSVGPHGDADLNVSLLGYAACVMACHYAINKFQVLSSNLSFGGSAHRRRAVYKKDGRKDVCKCFSSLPPFGRLRCVRSTMFRQECLQTRAVTTRRAFPSSS